MNVRTRRALAGMLLLGALVGAPWQGAAATPAGPQPEINEILATHPGGIQVSDNAVVWNGGDVVAVFPDPGQEYAPQGLGNGVNNDALRAAGAEFLADPTIEPQDVHGCPGGALKKDYYCFYVNRSWGGRRLQFSSTCSDFADNWGFNNDTESWVSNDVDKTIHTYDTGNGVLLWNQPENSSSSDVGSAKRNKMSNWTCS